MKDLGQEYFDVLMQTQFMPLAERPGYQRVLIERLLRHAREQVPFYRDSGRLDPLFRADGEIDLAGWHEVPPLTRREAQQNAEALYAEVVPPECGDTISGYTAGSTGTPLAFRISALMAAVGTGMLERGFVWAGLPPNLKLAWLRNDRNRSAAYPHGQIIHSVIRGTGRQTHFLAVQTPLEQQGQWLARVQPDVVISYPGALALLAQNLPEILSGHMFRLAVCLGEVTTEADRAAIENGFRCPILDLYSGSEFGPVAVEDLRLRRMFVCEESTLVEFLPRNGHSPTPPDAAAEVVLTPFYNYAMPLIRYAPGDYAVVDDGPQLDSRTLRRIAQVAGKERHSFILPSGRRWWPTFQNKIMYQFIDYKQIQFAQTAPDRIEIRFASDLAEPIKDAERLHAYLQAATPEPMHIALTRVTEVARRASGKYEYAVCELDPSLTAARIDARSQAPNLSIAPDIDGTAASANFVPSPSPPYRRDRTIKRLQRAWRHTQHLPVGELLKLQRDLLEPLLRHARAHVPFYRDSSRLDPAFNHDGTINWDRWRDIPALTRAEVQQAGPALYAERLPIDHGHTWVGATSGSTGEPVYMVRDALSGEAVWTAARLRDCEHHRLDPTKRLAIVRPFAHDPDDRSGIQRHSSWSFAFQSAGIFGDRIDIAEFLLPARIVDEIVAFQPNYLQCASAELEILCNWDGERRLRSLGLEVVISYQDHMDERTRQRVGDHLQARVISRYASEECGNIATTCAHCGRFHVHAESQFVETVSDDGSPTEPGGTGWLLVTPLYNYAMPLIRYYHADRVRVGRPGLCPITLTPFEDVLGKEPVLFSFPGDIVVRPILPPEMVARNLGAQIYQVVQVAEDRCEFRIVPGCIPADEMRFEELTEYMRARWWKDLQVDYRLMTELPATGARKHLTFLRAMN